MGAIHLWDFNEPFQTLSSAVLGHIMHKRNHCKRWAVTWWQDPQHCACRNITQVIPGYAFVCTRIFPSRVLNLQPTRELILLRTSSWLCKMRNVWVQPFSYTPFVPQIICTNNKIKLLTCTDIWGSSPGKTTSFPSFLHSTSAIGKAKTSHRNTALLPVMFTKLRGGTLMTGTYHDERERDQKRNHAQKLVPLIKSLKPLV